MIGRKMKPKIVVIAGPTASGKTACAVELCRRCNGEVVSADSMQIYRGMDVLSAKPTPAEMGGVPHHMIGIADPAEKYSAAKYRDAAKEVIADILSRGKMPVLCGGTGLYINAVTRPMEFAESCDEKLRQELIALSEQPGGRRKLHDMLREIDPEAAERLHENDVRRVTRAIEVFRLTGRTSGNRRCWTRNGRGIITKPSSRCAGPGTCSTAALTGAWRSCWGRALWMRYDG